MEVKEKKFAAHLGSLAATELQLATAVLWFRTHDSADADMSAGEIADALRELSLRGNVNRTRLTNSLARSRDVVRAQRAGRFKIKAGREAVFESAYGEFRRAVNIPVADMIISDDLNVGSSTHLNALRRQVNGCYEYGFYDACAVCCRRLLESLLISALSRHSNQTILQDGNGNIKPLQDLLGLATSGQFLKLSRSSAKIMSKVKDVGDAAAHSRFHLTSQREVDELVTGFRHVISELVVLSKL